MTSRIPQLYQWLS